MHGRRAHEGPEAIGQGEEGARYDPSLTRKCVISGCSLNDGSGNRRLAPCLFGMTPTSEETDDPEHLRST